jgi:nucleoside-diphosphate-sugar epimerase
MPEEKRILVAGATGKVGRPLVERLLSGVARDAIEVRALCHRCVLDARKRLEVVHGSIADLNVVRTIMEDVTRAAHLATCKGLPPRSWTSQ